MLLAESGGDGVHFGLGLLDRHTGFEASDDVVVFMVTIVGSGLRESKRDDKFGEFRPTERGDNLMWNGKVLGQDADDGKRLAVDAESLAEDVRIAAVTAGPRAVSQENSRGLSGGVLPEGEEATEAGFRAEHGKEIRRKADNADAFRWAVASEILVATDGDGDLFETGVIALDVEVLGCGEPVLRDVEAGRAVPKDDKAAGIREWEGAKEEGVGDRKDGGIGADSDGEGENCGESEARRAAEAARGNGEVLAKSGQHVRGIVVHGRTGEERDSGRAKYGDEQGGGRDGVVETPSQTPLLRRQHRAHRSLAVAGFGGVRLGR